MFDPQLIFAAVFFAALALFLLLKRRHVIVEWLIFPVVYMAMYRAGWGIKAMDSIAGRLRPLLKALGVVAVVIGFIGMGLISYQLVKNLSEIVTRSSSGSSVGIIQPFAKDVPGTIFVPFIYFIISIFIIAVLHEFSHGVMARVHKCKVKSSGFAFLGLVIPIIPAAFVEPCEKEMSRKSRMAQLSILAAGAVSNILCAAAVLMLIVYVSEPLVRSMVTPLGVEVVKVEKDSPAELAGLHLGELITSINDVQILDSKAMVEYLGARSPGDALKIGTNVSSHAAVLSAHPDGSGRPYMGFQVVNRFVVSDAAKASYGSYLADSVLWISGLLFWLFNLSLGIGLFNLVPLGPIDGGKMLRIGLSSWFEDSMAHRLWIAISVAFFSAILLNVGAAFFV